MQERDDVLVKLYSVVPSFVILHEIAKCVSGDKGNFVSSFLQPFWEACFYFHFQNSTVSGPNGHSFFTKYLYYFLKS